MSSDWPLKRLEEVADEVTVGYVGSMATEYVESGVPFLRSMNIEPFNINTKDLKFVTPVFHQRIKKSRLQPGDVAIVRTGQPGTCAVVPNWLVDANCSDLVIIRCGKELRPHFLCYWVNSVASHHISSHTVGAVQQHFNVGAAKKMNVAVPPLHLQDEVISVLGALDDRINLLRETNSTLEAIAQALFKSWFVDFDPVRAKIDGRVPEGVDDVTAALFPDEFEESELGMIPKGWGIKRLSDVLQARNERAENLIVPEYASTNDGLLPREKIYKKKLSASSAKNKLVKRDDLVFGLSRQVLNFGQMQDEIGSVSSAYKVYEIRADSVIPHLLGRLIRTRSDYFFNAVSASSREGQSVSSEALGMLSFVQPPMNVQQALSSLMQPLLEKGEACLQQAETLREVRDTLLPGLITGTIPLSKIAGSSEELLAA
ncbi:MAG TPA: restriction endonuclease subunit S [Burkholderiaceae bacterium]|nr:restriction endonuclease subunit S [Burkholderiaceae bacterium]